MYFFLQPMFARSTQILLSVLFVMSQEFIVEGKSL